MVIFDVILDIFEELYDCFLNVVDFIKSFLLINKNVKVNCKVLNLLNEYADEIKQDFNEDLVKHIISDNKAIKTQRLACQRKVLS